MGPENTLLTVLVARHVITPEQNDRIRACDTDACKVNLLLNILPKRGKHAFHEFCSALEKVEQGHIVDYLGWSQATECNQTDLQNCHSVFKISDRNYENCNKYSEDKQQPTTGMANYVDGLSAEDNTTDCQYTSTTDTAEGNISMTDMCDTSSRKRGSSSLTPTHAFCTTETYFGLACK